MSEVAWREAPWPIRIDDIPPMSIVVFIQQLLKPHRFFGVSKKQKTSFILSAAILLDVVWLMSILL